MILFLIFITILGEWVGMFNGYQFTYVFLYVYEWVSMIL